MIGSTAGKIANLDNKIETAPSLASAKTAFFGVKAQLSKNLEQIQQEGAALKLVIGVPPNYDLVIQKLDFQVPLSAVLTKFFLLICFCVILPVGYPCLKSDSRTYPRKA